MLTYATVGSNRLQEARTFYDALLRTIGMRKLYDHPAGGRLYGVPGRGMFGVYPPHDGNAATVGNGSMAGFGLDSAEDVAAFHAAALALGAVDAGTPGPRGPGGRAYFAYFRDLDGNKLCAYHIS